MMLGERCGKTRNMRRNRSIHVVRKSQALSAFIEAEHQGGRDAAPDDAAECLLDDLLCLGKKGWVFAREQHEPLSHKRNASCVVFVMGTCAAREQVGDQRSCWCGGENSPPTP